jgi:hypothetical protein
MLAVDWGRRQGYELAEATNNIFEMTPRRPRRGSTRRRGRRRVVDVMEDSELVAAALGARLRALHPQQAQ